jgi:hypothetical protein
VDFKDIYVGGGGEENELGTGTTVGLMWKQSWISGRWSWLYIHMWQYMYVYIYSYICERDLLREEEDKCHPFIGVCECNVNNIVTFHPPNGCFPYSAPQRWVFKSCSIVLNIVNLCLWNGSFNLDLTVNYCHIVHKQSPFQECCVQVWLQRTLQHCASLSAELRIICASPPTLETRHRQSAEVRIQTSAGKSQQDVASVPLYCPHHCAGVRILRASSQETRR